MKNTGLSGRRALAASGAACRRLACALLAALFALATTLDLSAAPGSGTAHPMPVPVIVVPGIAGSELAAGGETLWPPFDGGSTADVKDFAGAMRLVAASVSRLNRLGLDERCMSREKIAAPRSKPGRSGGAAAGSTFGTDGAYTALMRAIADKRGKENVYFFGYDWRLDNAQSATTLSRFIDDVRRDRGSARVDIVAHSMGGLVVSAYLGRYGSGAVRRVVLAGSPLAGAAEAATLLSSDAAPTTLGGVGAIFGNALLPSELQDLATRTGTSIYQVSQGLSATIAALARGYPSMYELLPAASLRGLSSAGPQRPAPPRLGSPAAAAGKARAFGASTLSRLGSIYRGVEPYVLVGKGKKTLASISAKGGSRYEDGDGLVTAASAAAGGILASRARYFEVDHLSLVTAPACLDYILKAIGD